MRSNDPFLESYEQIFSKWSGGKEKTPMLKRLTTWPEGKNALKSWTRQERLKLLKLDGDKTLGEPERILFHANRAALGLEILLMHIGDWLEESEEQTLKPKERSEAVNRIASNARALLNDFRILALPANCSKYFTQQELYDQYTDLFALFDLPGELETFSAVDFSKQIKAYLEFYYEDYPESVTNLEILFHKLTDKDLIEELAQPQVLNKVNAGSSQRVYVIRQMAGEFHKMFGKVLQQTIASFCVVIFNDRSISRETVKSALVGYDFKAPQNWRREKSLSLKKLAPDFLRELEELKRTQKEKARRRWRETRER